MRDPRGGHLRHGAIASLETRMTSSVSRLKVEGLTKSFFGVKVLHEVSFEAHGGRVLAVVGENGSGKSTTMNLLTGILPRDGGTMRLEGNPFSPRSRRESDDAGIAFIQQELNIFPNLSVAENLFLVHPPRSFAPLPLLSRRRMSERARDLLRRVGLEVAPNTLAGTLPTGERQLLEIARGLAGAARIFIFDEPTSSLTARETAQLFDVIRRLRQEGAAILYISHNLEEVLAIADEVIVLRDGRVTLRGACTSLTAADLVLAMVGRPIDALFPERAAMRPTATPVLEVTGLTEPGILKNVSLRLGRGEIVGIAGLMGSGRSEFARAVFGLDRYHRGAVRVGGKELTTGNVRARLAAGVAFLTEDRRHEGLMMDASVADNMALAALPEFASSLGKRIDRQRLLWAILELMERLNVKSGDARTSPVRSLSGGNQQKIVLGRWLLRNPTLFILDEPTRGVDVGAKQEIHRLLVQLADAGMAILVISSELEELIGMCDRIHVMRHGELNAEFPRERFDREILLRAAFGQGYVA
jgi:ribose transport system ATP-binding protein